MPLQSSLSQESITIIIIGFLRHVRHFVTLEKAMVTTSPQSFHVVSKCWRFKYARETYFLQVAFKNPHHTAPYQVSSTVSSSYVAYIRSGKYLMESLTKFSTLKQIFIFVGLDDKVDYCSHSSLIICSTCIRSKICLSLTLLHSLIKQVQSNLRSQGNLQALRFHLITWCKSLTKNMVS